MVKSDRKIEAETFQSQIMTPTYENVDYDTEKFPKAIRDMIESQGEESFIRRVIGIVRKHVRLHVNFDTGQIAVSIAGVIVINRTIKK